MKQHRSLNILLLILFTALALTGCSRASKEPAALAGCGILHEPEFGGIYIKNTIEEFNALGYQYGDSVDLRFSNGYVLEDLPYYNGYYVPTGEPLLIAYPGYDYIKAAISNGDDLWVTAGLSETDTASVTLREHGKYLDIQEARDIHYKDDRSLFGSDEVFANFRPLAAGCFRDCLLYRSASPCDNQHNRAPYVDALMQDAGVRFVLNLADTDEKILGYMAKDDFNSPCFAALYEEGCVDPIALNMNFGSEEFRGKIAAGLTVMAQHEGPYLIHCTEGKDRTGFVCMLLEALCGAGYGEIRDDYMITYANYYGITPEKDPQRYKTIVDSVLDPMIRSMAGDDSLDLQTADLSGYAEQFLFSGGMDSAAIDRLRAGIGK